MQKKQRDPHAGRANGGRKDHWRRKITELLSSRNREQFRYSKHDKKVLSEIYYTSERLSCQVIERKFFMKSEKEKVIRAIYSLATEIDTENEKITGKTIRWSKQETNIYKEISEIADELPEKRKERQQALIDELLEDFQQDGFAAGFRWGALLMSELLAE